MDLWQGFGGGWQGGIDGYLVDGVELGVYYTHVKSADLIRELKKAGWELDRVRGSHYVFKHESRPGHVTVPHPKTDLGVGLVAAIRKQAGL